MATLVTNIPSVLWSGNVPDLEITATDHVNIEVDVDGAAIFSSTIYAYNGQASFVELAELVEQYMEDEGAHVSEITVYDVDDSDPTDKTQLCQFDVIYCALNISNSCDDFCRNNFLTTAHAKRLVPGVTEMLYFHDPDDAGDVLRLQVAYRDGNKVRVATVNDASSLMGAFGISFDVDGIASLADVDDVVMVTFMLGSRHMMYHINDIPADAVFQFMNCFNVPEVLPLNCVTTRKQEGERSVAKVRRRSVLASLDHAVEHDVDTAPLSNDEMSLVEQMCESHYVSLLPSGDEIVIASRTCEFSNERGAMPTAKFTWTYRDGRRHAAVVTPVDDGIFSDEYDSNYE